MRTSSSSVLASPGSGPRYYLTKADPSLRVIVVEREIAGFGASGRNGGWVVGELAAPLPAVARSAGADAAVAMARAMHATVDEVGAVADAEGIDCQFAKGGALYFAINRAQLERLDARYEMVRRFGFGDDDYRRLSARETTARLNASGVHGGLFSTHCAVVHPARLRPRVGRGRRAARSWVVRTDQRDADRAPASRDDSRARAGRCRRSRHRGVHRGVARPGARARSGRELHDRHRTAGPGDVGRDRT